MSIKQEEEGNYDDDFVDTFNEAKESKSSENEDYSMSKFKKPPVEKHNVPDDFKLLVLNLILANMSKSLVASTELQKIREKRREEQVYQLRKIASNIYSEEFDKILKELSIPEEIVQSDPLRGEIRMVIKKEICQKLFSQKDSLEDSVIKKKSTNVDEENNNLDSNPGNVQPVSTPQRRRIAPSLDLQFMSPIMSPPPGMILEEDEICTPNGISRADSNSDFDSLTGFALPPSQAFANFSPQRLSFSSSSQLNLDTDLTQNPPPPTVNLSPYKLRSSRLTRCTTFSPTLKDKTRPIYNVALNNKPRAMTTLESDIIIPNWGDDIYNEDNNNNNNNNNKENGREEEEGEEEEEEDDDIDGILSGSSSSPSPYRYKREESKSSSIEKYNNYNINVTPQLVRSQTTIDGVNDPLTLNKRREKSKLSNESSGSGSTTSTSTNGKKNRLRRRLPPFSPTKEKLTSLSAGDETFAEYSHRMSKKYEYDRPRSTGSSIFNNINNNNNNLYRNNCSIINNEIFYSMNDVPVDLMRLKDFVLRCPFENERDRRWFRCLIRKKKDGKTVYECGFFSEEEGNQFLVICYSRRKRFISTSKYIISLLESDLFDKIKGEGYLGKLQCNFRKTIFMLYRDVISNELDDSCGDDDDSDNNSYINYGIIMYTPNNKNPAYNYQVCIPSLLRNGEMSYIWRCKKNEKDGLYEAFMEIQEKGAQNALYEDKIKCFSLPTRIIGRTLQYQMTTINSVKNCSLIKASPESLPLKMDLFKSSSSPSRNNNNNNNNNRSNLIMGNDINNNNDLDTCFRLCKTSDCLYTLDFRYPFSLFQAFAVALSRF